MQIGIMEVLRMKITDVKTTAMKYPMDYTFSNAVDGPAMLRARQCLIVEVFTDEGIAGVGEADLVGCPPETTMAVIEKELKPLVLGKDPLAVEQLWELMYSARIMHGRRGLLMHAISGIDIALWDIIGKAAGLPLCRLLGCYSDRVPAYASGGMYKGTDEENPDGMNGLQEEIETAVRRGFRAYKMKIGKRRLSIAADMRRVEEARRLLGPDTPLMVDCNCSWDYARAVKTIPYLEELDVKFIEEPVPVDMVETSARIAATTRIPIAGYESETHLLGFLDLMQRGKVYYLQPDACRVGGITALRKIIALSQVYEREICTHAWSSAVSLAANLHLMATASNADFLEYDINPNALREELSVHPFILEQGNVLLPQRPGLGVELNPDTVKKYSLKV